MYSRIKTNQRPCIRRDEVRIEEQHIGSVHVRTAFGCPYCDSIVEPTSGTWDDDVFLSTLLCENGHEMSLMFFASQFPKAKRTDNTSGSADCLTRTSDADYPSIEHRKDADDAVTTVDSISDTDIPPGVDEDMFRQIAIGLDGFDDHWRVR